MIVGALDPGVNSGLIIADLPKGGVPVSELKDHVVFAGEVNSGCKPEWSVSAIAAAEVKACNVIGQIFNDYGVEHWVIEDFVLQPGAYGGDGSGGGSGARSGLSPVRLTSMLLFGLEFGSEACEVDVTFQMPATMAVANDQRLKRWGLWYAGKKDLRQAAKHLVAFNKKER